MDFKSLLKSKHVSEDRKKKILKKLFRDVCKKRYKKGHKIKEYESIRSYYISLNIITEEEVIEIEKEMEEKYRK